VELLELRPGLMLGATPKEPQAEDRRLTLAPGETLALYTDGFTEAFAPDGKTMFGVERLTEVLGRTGGMPLSACAEQARAAVERFTGKTELQDDQTLLLLRRR
jgi:serine phosphatase RsbU (regulator of sigma subunit)